MGPEKGPDTISLRKRGRIQFPSMAPLQLNKMKGNCIRPLFHGPFSAAPFLALDAFGQKKTPASSEAGALFAIVTTVGLPV